MKPKMQYKVMVDPNFQSRGEYLVINLNGELNSAIPTKSPDLEQFKADKLTEIGFFAYPKQVEGIELLQA